MADIVGLTRGSPAVAFSSRFRDESTLPGEAEHSIEIIRDLVRKVSDIQVELESKVSKNGIKSEIALGSELVLISGVEVAVAGNFTVIDLVNEQNGTTSGNMPISITRIVGDLVQTGAIQSNNWGSSQGTQLDLDNATFKLGGSADPVLEFDGSDLLVAGDIITDGQIKGTGDVTSALGSSAILGEVGDGYYGVIGIGTNVGGAGFSATTGIGCRATATAAGGTGGQFFGGHSSSVALVASNTAGGRFFTCNGDIGGFPSFEFEVEIQDAINLLENTSPPSAGAGDCWIFGGNTGGGETILGWNAEYGLDSGSYSPTWNRRVMVQISGTDVYLFGQAA